MSNKLYRLFSVIVLIVSASLIFYLSHQNGEESSASSGSFHLFLEMVLHMNISESFLRTAAHFCEYVFLGFVTVNCVFALRGRLNPFGSAVFGTVYAVSDEIHQIFVPGRAFQLFDLGVDFAGIITGVLLFSLTNLIIVKIKERKGTK
ncbi:MAG: VanZ like family protein [Firmicutes bacterium ADurb.Bin300]|jgi:VanZ family protein|nr:MAG: VanZ like family protein [Firmicutes bacterium ADurb.Bin300]